MSDLNLPNCETWETGTESFGLPDRFVTTWSGRTQEQTNKENPSPFDFKANGNGVDDDTQAFADLEKMYQGRIIDLFGRTYYVNKTFFKNIYKNGFWKIDSDKIPVNGELDTKVSKAFDVKAACKDKGVSLYKMFYAGGRGSNRTLQSVAQDCEGNFYSNHNTTIDNNPTVVSVLNKYSDDSPVITRFTDFMLPDDRLGHQGLAVLHQKSLSDTVFFTSSPDEGDGVPNHSDFNYSVGGSRGVVQFKWRSNEIGEIDKPVQYRLVSADTPAGSSTTPTISTCGRWLIIRYAPNGQNGQHIFRVFSTHLFDKNIDTDLSNKYTHEFSINMPDLLKSGDSIHSLSGFCSDGNHLYAVAAGLRSPVTQPKYLLSCDLMGRNVEVAKGDMFEKTIQPESGVSPTFVETEGLLIIKSGGKDMLACVVISDTPNHTSNTRRFAALYTLASKSERKEINVSGINLYEKGSTPYSPTQIKVEVNALNGIEQKKCLTIDNGQSGTGDILHLQRNGVTTLKVYSSTTNVALTAPQGDRDLNLGATTHNGVDDATAWNWVITTGGNLQPYRDNTYRLGRADRLVREIFSATPTINVSDERLKQQFRSQTKAEKAAALEIKNSICIYKFNDAVDLKGDGARWHCGVKAQEVVSIMQNHGLNPFDYGFVCFDEWDAIKEAKDDDGNVIQEARESGNRYAIRYNELSMFILAAI